MQTPLPSEQMTGAAERYRTLLEINNAIISNLTQDALFHAIAQALRRVVPFDRTAVFLHDPTRDVLKLFVLESSLPSEYFVVGLEMPPRDSHVGWVFLHQQPLLRQDLAKEPQYPMERRAYADGVRSYVIVPLAVRGRAIGTLAVASTAPMPTPASGSRPAAVEAPARAIQPPGGGDGGPRPPAVPASSGLATLEEMERRHILAALAQTGGVIEGPKGAARVLNLHANTLRSRMKKLGINRSGHEVS